MPSFELALAAGADLVEFDYHVSRDGVPVVIHDPTVSRTTDFKRGRRRRSAEVRSLTAAELRTLDAGSWKAARYAGTRIPTLAEAIDSIRDGDAVPLIERKEGSAHSLARLLRGRGLVNQVVVIAFDWDFLCELRRLLPEQVLGALGPSARTRRLSKIAGRDLLTASTVNEVAHMGVDIIVWNNRLNRTSVAAAHARGLRVWVYTVNDPDEAAELVNTGTDGLITDNPARMWRSLALHE